MISDSKVSWDGALCLNFLWMLAAMAMPLVASAQVASTLKNGDIDLTNCDSPNVFRTFASAPGETLNTTYKINGAGGNVFLDVTPETNCTGSNPTLSCFSSVVTVQAPTPSNSGVPSSSTVNM